MNQHPTLDLPLSIRAACGIALIVASGACDRTPSGSQARVPEVTVITVAPRQIAVSSDYVGQVESARQVHIVSRVNGFLEERLFTEGMPVRQGQVLYQIDPKPFHAQVQAAKAALAQQEAAYALAKSNLGRIEPLAAANAASKKDLDQARGQERQNAAGVESARANLAQAELNLGYTRITSPVSGMASASQVSAGTYVTASNELTTVFVVSPINVNFSGSADDLLAGMGRQSRGELKLPTLKTAQVELRLADGSLFPETGSLVFASPEFNPKTGTFLMRSSFPNRAGLLRPGQFVKVRLKGMTMPAAVSLPQRAVLQSAKGHYVLVVAPDGKAAARPVTAGNFQDDNWIITKGLSAGESVIVDGGAFLKPGTPVKPTPLAESGVSAPSGR